MNFGRAWRYVNGYKSELEVLHEFPVFVVLAKQFVVSMKDMGQMSDVSSLDPSGTVGFGFKNVRWVRMSSLHEDLGVFLFLECPFCQSLDVVV